MLTNLQISELVIRYDNGEYVGTFYAKRDEKAGLRFCINHDQCIEMLKLVKWELHNNITGISTDYDNMFFTKVDKDEPEIKDSGYVYAPIDATSGSDNSTDAGIPEDHPF